MDNLQTPIPSPNFQSSTGSSQAGTTPVPSKFNKLLVIKIVVGIVIVGIIGSGIFLWYSPWNPFRPDPEKMLIEAFSKMAKVESLHYDIEMNVDLNGDDAFSYSSLIINGDSDTINPENPKHDIDFDFTMRGKDSGKPEELLSLIGEMRQAGKDSYFKLTTIELPQELLFLVMMFELDLDAIQGQWIILKGSSETEEDKGVIPEQMTGLFLEYNPFQFKKQLKDEKINGKKTYHYLFSLNKESWKKFLIELEKDNSSNFDSSAEQEISKQVDDLFAMAEKIDIEFWIGKKDKLLYRLKIEEDLYDEKTKSSGPLKVDIRLSNFNEPITVEKPANAKTLEEILQGDSPFSRQEQSKTARIKADMNQLQSAAFILFADEYSYANLSCENQMIKPICNDIKKQIGANPVIHQSKGEFCAYVVFPADYICIDSEFNYNETIIFPETSGYCDGKSFLCPPSQESDSGPIILKKMPLFLGNLNKKKNQDESSDLFQASIKDILLEALKR